MWHLLAGCGEYADRVRTDESLYDHDPSHQRRCQYIVANAVGRVLDVGCGDGYIAQRLRAAVAVDIDYIRCQRTRQRGIQVVQADACRLPFRDGAFDTVVVSEVLEHLVNPGVGLSECVRCATQRVVFSFPIGDWREPTHRYLIHYTAIPAHDPTLAGNEMLVVRMDVI